MRARLRVRVHGGHGWIVLAAFVLAWDLRAPETLSTAFSRAPRAVQVLATGLTVAHLLDVLPDRCDPFHLLGRSVRRGTVLEVERV